MATVASFCTWALQETGLKAFLGVVGTAEDLNLQLYLAAAAETADQYLDLTTAEIALFTTLPEMVRLAVYSGVRAWRFRSNNSGLMEAKTKDLTEKFSSAFAADAAMGDMRTLLRPFKLSTRELDGR